MKFSDRLKFAPTPATTPLFYTIALVTSASVGDVRTQELNFKTEHFKYSSTQRTQVSHWDNTGAICTEH